MAKLYQCYYYHYYTKSAEAVHCNTARALIHINKMAPEILNVPHRSETNTEQPAGRCVSTDGNGSYKTSESSAELGEAAVRLKRRLPAAFCLTVPPRVTSANQEINIRGSNQNVNTSFLLLSSINEARRRMEKPVILL